jgi:hypothetical protein
MSIRSTEQNVANESFSQERIMGKRSGAGRRKVGRKKRRMRAKIRHRKG